MVSFVQRQAVWVCLGAAANKWKSFPLAALASFFIAACSCTVVPVSSGLYYTGAGVGAAFVILWVAPAANILTPVCTGQILGTKMILARVIAALLMAFIVGWVMSVAFRAEASRRRTVPQPPPFLFPPALRILIAPLSWNVTPSSCLSLILTLLAPHYLIVRGPYWQKVLVWAVLTFPTALYVWWRLSGSPIRD